LAAARGRTCIATPSPLRGFTLFLQTGNFVHSGDGWGFDIHESARHEHFRATRARLRRRMHEIPLAAARQPPYPASS
jgi:hypothetical protein